MFLGNYAIGKLWVNCPETEYFLNLIATNLNNFFVT